MLLTIKTKQPALCAMSFGTLPKSSTAPFMPCSRDDEVGADFVGDSDECARPSPGDAWV